MKGELAGRLEILYLATRVGGPLGRMKNVCVSQPVAICTRQGNLNRVCGSPSLPPTPQTKPTTAPSLHGMTHTRCKQCLKTVCAKTLQVSPPRGDALSATRSSDPGIHSAKLHTSVHSNCRPFSRCLSGCKTSSQRGVLLELGRELLAQRRIALAHVADCRCT